MGNRIITVLVLSSIKVQNVFRYNDSFQILPAPTNAPRPPAELNHHPCIIEFKCEESDETRKTPNGRELPKSIINNEISQQTLKEILLLLTAFSRSRVFTYRGKQSWFKSHGVKGKEISFANSEWGEEGYDYKEFNPSGGDFSDPNVAKVNLVEPNQYFNNYGRMFGESFDLPSNIDTLLSSYYSLDNESREAFLSSCSLFDQGIELCTTHPSISFAAIVSSLETLIAHTFRAEKPKKCDKCEQMNYRVVFNFKNFLSMYGSSTPEFKKYAQKVYEYRSKILHEGKLFLGEIKPIKFASFDGIEDDELRRRIIKTCRICMVGWLTKHERETV